MPRGAPVQAAEDVDALVGVLEPGLHAVQVEVLAVTMPTE